MTNKKQKFYAVTRRRDNIHGIFTMWNECSSYVTGVNKAIYQGCSTLQDAKHILASAWKTLKVYRDGIWLPCEEFEKQQTANPLNVENAPEKELTHNSDEKEEGPEYYLDCSDHFVNDDNTPLESSEAEQLIGSHVQTQELAQKEVNDETLLKCADEDPVVKPKKVVSHNNTSSTKNEKSGNTSHSLGSCHVCRKIMFLLLL